MKAIMKTHLKKSLLMTVLLMGAAPALFAQDKGRLEGRVEDEQNRPLPQVTVALVDLYFVTEVKIVQTDSSGRFAIDEIPYGLFACKISRTGYQSIARDSIVFTPISGTISLGDLSMSPATPKP